MPRTNNWKPLVYWLDNDGSLHDDFKSDVKKAFIGASRELQMTECEPESAMFKKGAILLDYIKNQDVMELAEIVVCDFSLDNDDLENGARIVEEIQELRYPTEVLIYGAAYEELERVNQDVPGWYGKLVVCDDGNSIKEALDSAAIRSLVKWQDKEFLRGLIISRASDFEVELDKLLEEFYQVGMDIRNRFGSDVLQADLLGFGRKIEIVSKILTEVPNDHHIFNREWKKNMNTSMAKIRDLRNRAAHGTLEVDANGGFTLTDRGRAESLGRKGIGEHFYRTYSCRLKLSQIQDNLPEITNIILGR